MRTVLSFTPLFMWLFLGGTTAAQEESALGPPSAIPVPDQVSQRLRALLPDAGQAGASVVEGPYFYTPANLYEYIDGAAEAFIAYDFAHLAHQVYTKDDTEVTVDIYDMEELSNAFGIYSSERSPDYNYSSIGAEGYLSESLLNFFQGPYYVKLSAFGDKGSPDTVLTSLAREISSRIGSGKELPRPLTLFPSEGLVAHSHVYFKRSPLGREFLAPAYSAKYLIDGRETTVVLSLASSASDALSRVQLLRDHIARSGEVSDSPHAPGAILGTTRYEGTVLCFARGSVTVVMVNPPPVGDPLLARLLAALPEEPLSGI